MVLLKVELSVEKRKNVTELGQLSGVEGRGRKLRLVKGTGGSETKVEWGSEM